MSLESDKTTIEIRTTILRQNQHLAQENDIKISTALNTGVRALVENWEHRIEQIPKLQKLVTTLATELERVKNGTSS